MVSASAVVTIDGPSGSGKGTISRLVAHRLGWHYLDSGAIYRAVGLAVAKHGVNVHDEASVAACAAQMRIAFQTRGDGEEPRVLVDGEDLTDAVRLESAATAASAIAAMPMVRAVLLQLQRDFRKPPGLVADGRDMGTVVFADADVKVFLTASAQERAQRRHKQLKAKGVSVSIGDLLGEIVARDARDANRAVAPLKPAATAVVIDTSAREIAAIVDEVLGLVPDALKCATI